MLSIKLSENAGRAPEAVPFMPAGQHSICATVNGKPGRRVVTVDREACDRLQADLSDHLRASAAGEKARPMLMFDHTAGNAAAKPLGFEWDDERGILLRVEWTKAGREAVEGGNYGYVSPAFRLAKGTGQILGLAGGVEVGSLVNDPAFERNECIAASRAEEPEEVQVDYVETANPYGCNQHGHREGHKTPGWLKEPLAEREKRGKAFVEEAKEKPETVSYDGSEVRQRMREDKEREEEDKWLQKNRGTKRFDMTKEDHIAYLKHKITEGKKRSESVAKYEEELKRLTEEEEKKEPERLKASVPPRGEIEKNTLLRENKTVADTGATNNRKTKMEEIKKMLGLPPNADDSAVLSAIRALKTQGAEAKSKTEAIEAECEQHKKALAEHKEKAADGFVKRLKKDGTIATKDEEKAKAARALYMADPEQAEIMFCGLRAAHADVLEDEVHANRVIANDGDFANKSLEELLNEN